MSFSKSLLLAVVALGQALVAPASESAELDERATHNDIATFYEQGGVAGSCGQVHPDSSKIAALSNYWQKGQSPGPKCGHKIKITNKSGGQGKGNTVMVTVADTCPGCDKNHLDLSYGAFKQLTGGKLDPPGRIDISWDFF